MGPLGSKVTGSNPSGVLPQDAAAVMALLGVVLGIRAIAMATAEEEETTPGTHRLPLAACGRPMPATENNASLRIISGVRHGARRATRLARARLRGFVLTAVLLAQEGAFVARCCTVKVMGMRERAQHVHDPYPTDIISGGTSSGNGEQGGFSTGLVFTETAMGRRPTGNPDHAVDQATRVACHLGVALPHTGLLNGALGRPSRPTGGFWRRPSDCLGETGDWRIATCAAPTRGKHALFRCRPRLPVARRART